MKTVFGFYECCNEGGATQNCRRLKFKSCFQILLLLWEGDLYLVFEGERLGSIAMPSMTSFPAEKKQNWREFLFRSHAPSHVTTERNEKRASCVALFTPAVHQ